MADNFTINGTTVGGGPSIAMDNISSVLFQRIKLVLGATDVDNGNVSAANPIPISGPVTGTVVVSSISATVNVTVVQPTLFVGRVNYTTPQTDAAVVTPTSGKSLNITRLMVMTDNDNTAKLTFRLGCGTTNTPTTTGVIMSHPGMSNNKEFVVGTGRDVISIGAVNQSLRITASDPTGSWDVCYEYFET